jgi:gliding motility-associated lipoprotein GldD
MKPFIITLIGCLLLACGEDYKPKPKAQLRLEYPEAKYKSINEALPFTFEKNVISKPIKIINIDSSNNILGINIVYPKLKGTIYLTYAKIKNKENLKLHLIDAQNLTQKHTMKADEIIESPFEDTKNRVFGMYYEVGGDAASQSQFYVTDSINHFLNGSLYFYAKPNYDSIFPAAEYLKKDIKHIIETFRWE